MSRVIHLRLVEPDARTGGDIASLLTALVERAQIAAWTRDTEGLYRVTFNDGSCSPRRDRAEIEAFIDTL